MYDKKLFTIAVGKSRTDQDWQNQDTTWDGFCDCVCNTHRTAETVADYDKCTNESKTNIKDVGGFVGGKLSGGQRTKDSVVSRSMITLDMDYAQSDTWDRIKSSSKFDFACCLYSTHKHKPSAPRYRLIIPLASDVTPTDYTVLSSVIAEKIGKALFDPTTHEPNRMMFWPSTSSDGIFFFDRKAGDFLDPQDILKEAATMSETQVFPSVPKDKLSDPTLKKGIVGAFCRTFTVTGAIQKFLSHIYEPSSVANRFRYYSADSVAGLIVYEDKYAYSHHATDPVQGKSLNAFDLVRLHLFGTLDENVSQNTRYTDLPSYKAMCNLAKEEGIVKNEYSPASSESDTNLLTKLENALKTDPLLQNIRYNENSGQIDVKGYPAWLSGDSNDDQKTYPWNSMLNAKLMTYIAKTYNLQSKVLFPIALLSVASERRYHPIKEYLESLPSWDGTERVDTLLSTYFTTEDNAYTRQVIRKTLLAAIARVYHPGTKFDNMLILCGAQGIQKSEFFKRLAVDWFSDSLTFHQMNDKTAAEQIQGVWLMEMGELVGRRKADIESIKRFLSCTSDNYRPCYGINTENHPRQTVIVGTTNAEDGFLRDPTGNRRFWPVNVAEHPINHPRDMTTDIVAQIWAEAFVYYRRGESLILDEDALTIAKKEQENAIETNPSRGLVEKYLNTLLPKEWEQMDLDERRSFLHGDNYNHRVGTEKRIRISYIEIWCECFEEDVKYNRVNIQEIRLILNSIPGWNGSATKQVKTRLYGNQRCIFYEQL